MITKGRGFPILRLMGFAGIVYTFLRKQGLKIKRLKRIVFILKVVCVTGCVTGVTGVTGCVAPFYGTARIEEGLHVETGVCAMSYIGAFGEWSAPSIGGMANVALFYGFNPYVQLGSRLSLGYGQTGFIVHDTAGNPHNPWEIFGDATLNVQAAIPGESTTLALRLEGSASRAVTASLLLGLGKTEKVTLGIRGFIVGRGIDIMTIVRPLPKLSLFIGVDPVGFFMDTPWPVATLGIGCKLK